MAACRVWLRAVVLGVLAAGLAAGCTGGGQGVVARRAGPPAADTQGGWVDLPSPAELAESLVAPRGTSYGEEDLVFHGRQYNTDWSSSMTVSLDGDSAVIDAKYESQGAAGLGYCLYLFTVKGFDLDVDLHYLWEVAPTDLGKLYFGLADWDRDCWAWFTADDVGSTDIGNPAPFVHDYGTVVVAVVVADECLCRLRWIKLGEMPEPSAALTATANGPAPVEVTLDASASEPVVWYFVRHQWDWEGDGVWDYETATDAVVTHVYETAGRHTPRVQVTTVYDISAEAEAEFDALAPWAHSWGTPEIEELKGVAGDGTGVYAAGFIWIEGHGYDGLLTKYNHEGHFQWAKSVGSGAFQRYRDVAAPGNETIYVVGHTDENGTDTELVVQCWRPGGTILGTSCWGVGGTDLYGMDIEVLGGAIYVGGLIEPTATGYTDILVAKFDLPGNIEWARSLGGSYDDEFGGLDVAEDDGSSVEVHVAGSLGTNATETELLHCIYSDAGTLIAARRWTNAVDDVFGQDVAVDLMDPARVFVTGRLDPPGIETHILLLESMIGGTPLIKGWDILAEWSKVGHRLLLLDSGFAIAGTYDLSIDDSQGYLMHVDSSGSLSGAQLFSGEGQPVSFVALAPFPGSGLLMAGECDYRTETNWSSTTFTEKSVAGNWTYATVDSTVLTGTHTDADEMKSPVDATGTQDNPVGETEGLVAARQAP